MKRVPFTHGVNLTQWFEVPSAAAINRTKFTKETFSNIKSLGADVVRLPIHFENISNKTHDYLLDEDAMKLLDSVCDWCEALGLYLVIDNHSFFTHDALFDDIEYRLERIWTQVASRYKSRSDKIIFEIYNEPHKCKNETWAPIQGRIIKLIRKIDTSHTLVVGGVDYNSYQALNALPLYDDDNLIYTFHFYNPFLFTHQGASWAEPSLVPLAGVPFPYDAKRMPRCPSELIGTCWEQGLSSYAKDADITILQSQLGIPAQWAKQHNVPVWCGEFGSLKTNARFEDRALWYATMVNILRSYNIPWTCWDYYGGFGLFKKESQNRFPEDLEVSVVQALGFKCPGE